jgi:hypothetical protein
MGAPHGSSCEAVNDCSTPIAFQPQRCGLISITVIATASGSSSDWLGRVGSVPSISTEKQFGNPCKAYCSDDCSHANPAPPGCSKRQEAQAITQGSNSAKDEKWSREATMNATAAGSVDQTRYTHECERRSPQNRSQPWRRAKAQRESNPRCTPEKARARPFAQDVALRTPRIGFVSTHF